MTALPETPSPTRDAIFASYEADADTGFRPHLGASQIGKSCERALWYDFRWTTPSRFPGRILRLFETGQLEEARLVRNLRRTGATVLEVDPETGRQWRVEAHGGHFGGSLDAVAFGLIEAPKTWHVLEFKTHSAKSFRELVAKGVAEAKPQHRAQMQIYMHLTGLTRAIYLAVCKDTDDLHVERVRGDGDAAERLLAKADRVIHAPRPPARISEDPDLVRVPVLRPPRPLSWRRRRRGDLPLLPAFVGGRRRMALRPLGPGARRPGATRRLRSAPLHPRSGARRGGRCRR